MRFLIDLILHIDTHLAGLIAQYGKLTYAFLFAILFCETGFIVTPFLPGDSLLFAAGALSAAGGLSVWILLPLLMLAAIAGDAVNYWIGREIGAHIVARGSFLRMPVKKQHVDRASALLNQYGARAVVMARFMPIVRTFAPFVAGMGGMHYGKFATFNVVGGVLWVSLFTLAGYFFGNVPAIKHNFTLVILGIIIVSLVPPVLEILRASREEAAAEKSKR